eukprot:gene22120-29180_t
MSERREPPDATTTATALELQLAEASRTRSETKPFAASSPISRSTRRHACSLRPLPKPMNVTSMAESSFSSQQQPSAGGAKEFKHTLIFDLRERETYFDREDQARLVAGFAQFDLNLTPEELDSRMESLIVLIPDMASMVYRLQPSILASLLSDISGLAQRLLDLKAVLPRADVSKLVARAPALLLPTSANGTSEWIQKLCALSARDPRCTDVLNQVEKLKKLLGITDVDNIIEQEPRLLDVQGVEEALEDMARLMPKAFPMIACGAMQKALIS